MTVDEILAALQAIIDGARDDEGGDRPLSDEEAARYEELETQLATARRNVEIRSRQSAYLTPVRGAHGAVTGASSKDDTLERAFDNYLRTGVPNADMAELRTQNIGTPGDGGYTVPDTFLQKLVDVRKAYGGLSEHAENITTSNGQPIEFPSLNDTANVGGITGESAAFVDGADLAFGTVTLGAYKFTSTGEGTTTPLRVSVELLQDSAFDIQALVSRKLGERIARKQALMWTVGTGSGEPDGIVGSGVTEDEDVDVHDVIDYDDLLDLEALLDPEYEANAKWIMSKATWTVIRAIVADGRPLILPSAEAGIGSQPEKTLLGYPVIIDQGMPGFPGAGDEHFLALGDWREAYIIRRVANLSVVVNPYSRANNGEVEFTAWERADGTVQNRAAYKVLANTAS